MMMRNLPEKVSEEDIEEMFSYADKDRDGKLSYSEFQVMINPLPPLQPPRPDIGELKKSKPNTRAKVQEKRRGEEKVVIRKSQEKTLHFEPSDDSGPLPLSLENIKLHDKMTKNISLKK